MVVFLVPVPQHGLVAPIADVVDGVDHDAGDAQQGGAAEGLVDLRQDVGLEGGGAPLVVPVEQEGGVGLVEEHPLVPGQSQQLFAVLLPLGGVPHAVVGDHFIKGIVHRVKPGLGHAADGLPVPKAGPEGGHGAG